jgi:nucleoside-diphosphate-sugar epimerase
MTFWHERAVFVTGATGFVGSHLTERLWREGACVRVLARDPQKLPPELRDRVEVVCGDLLQLDGFVQALADCDCVFHVAAWLGRPNRRETAYAVNVDATRQLVEAARAAGVRRFVGTSSIAVYGPVPEGVVDETWPSSDVYLYSETKTRGEQAVFAAQTDRLSVTVLRPAQVFGPRGGAWTTLPVKLVRRGLPMLIGGGQGLAHPVYVENLVDAYLLAAQREEAMGEAFTICDADMPWRDFYGRYAAMLGKRPRSIPAWLAWGVAFSGEIAAKLTRRPPPFSRAMLGYVTGRCTFSTEKARRLLGWSPRFSFDEAMSRTEAWLRAAGYL